MQRLHVIFLRASQFATWPIAFVYFHLLYRLRINGRCNLKAASNPFIIVANHVNFADSFLFRLILGFLTSHLPLRFTGVRRFDWRWLNFMAKIGVIDFVYDLFGVLTIIPGLGLQKNLEESRRVLRTGGVVVIYPEGKIAIEKEVLPFKPGAAVLAMEMGVPIVPVSFRFGPRRFVWRSLIVNVGEQVKIPKGMNVADALDLLHGAVARLYTKE